MIPKLVGQGIRSLGVSSVPPLEHILENHFETMML